MFFLHFPFFSPLQGGCWGRSGKITLMTVLRCWWLAEISVPGASFGAAQDAAAAETPITDQVPADWLLTVTSVSVRGSESERTKGAEVETMRHSFIALVISWVMEKEWCNIHAHIGVCFYVHVCFIHYVLYIHIFRMFALVWLVPHLIGRTPAVPPWSWLVCLFSAASQWALIGSCAFGGVEASS